MNLDHERLAAIKDVCRANGKVSPSTVLELVEEIEQQRVYIEFIESAIKPQDVIIGARKEYYEAQ
jgi:hypothetical protein